MILGILKVFVPTALSFFLGLAITPVISHYLYKYKTWKKQSVHKTIDGYDAVISKTIHNDEGKKTPRMGGLVIWISVLLTALITWVFSHFFWPELFSKFDFISRSQTWIPLTALLMGSVVGFLDDLLAINGNGKYIGGGLSLSKRLASVMAIGLACALWFYLKLDVESLGLPFGGELRLGAFFIPFFLLVIMALYSGGIIDGIDGLSGGVFASMFSAYAVIAFNQQQFDLSAFCAVVTGGILAFLWFNIPPARFYMSETGTMGLTVTLGIVAFMTDKLGGGYGVLVLPVIAMPLLLTSASVIVQILSKKLRKKKVFLVAPLHHHLEAIGWPSYKVTMRYWILSIMLGIIGLSLAIIG